MGVACGRWGLGVYEDADTQNVAAAMAAKVIQTARAPGRAAMMPGE